jgi:serine-type D-Ala-D-Ala carboxypeptidase (penicillin-binding protein 5/6)
LIATRITGWGLLVWIGLWLVGSSGKIAWAVPVDQQGPTVKTAARAAVVIDDSTGAVLYGDRPFDELPPASLTKMVTALVALERGDLDQRVEPQGDYDVEPILIGIGVGDSLRLEDALYGLLLNSGNDAGSAIAESVGQGSIPRFVGWMNQFVRRLGLSHTHFLNPHGLDQSGHVSSAYDMAIIGRALMRQPILARIVGERRRVIEGPPRWLFQTTNPLLGSYPGADGIKTGYDTLAGRCLAATAVRDGRRAIAVVLNSDRYVRDTAALLDAAFEDFSGLSQPDSSASARSVRVPVGVLRVDLDSVGAAEKRSVFRVLRGDLSLRESLR